MCRHDKQEIIDMLEYFLTFDVMVAKKEERYDMVMERIRKMLKVVKEEQP